MRTFHIYIYLFCIWRKKCPKTFKKIQSTRNCQFRPFQSKINYNKGKVVVHDHCKLFMFIIFVLYLKNKENGQQLFFKCQHGIPDFSHFGAK